MASEELVDEDRNLETLLARATNPLHKQPDAVSLVHFCEFIDKERDGPQTALRLLAHKIQSPLEKESLLALAALEEAVSKCGPKFRCEFGKFRFLNELIKVVSPKYLGHRASPKVKQKIIELMFSWSIDLKSETKIFEAYQMLKRQGVVIEDPVYVREDCKPVECPPPRAKNAIFDDEENSQQLQKLLHSSRPEDLQAANKLIKNMVKEADKRMEQLAKRSTELETIRNNAQVLTDMLDHFDEKDTSSEERDLMKELYESCARLRPKLFRLAGEMDEKEDGLNEILKANDELTIVISRYKKTMGIPTENIGDTNEVSNDQSKNGATLLDLGSPDQQVSLNQPSDSSLLDDQLLALGLNDPPDVPLPNQDKQSSNPLTDLDQIFRLNSSAKASSLVSNLASSMSLASTSVIDSNIESKTTVASLKPLTTNTPMTNTSNTKPKIQSTNSASKGMSELDELGQSMLKQSLPSGAQAAKLEFVKPTTPQKIPLSQLKQQKDQEAVATSSSIVSSLPDLDLLTKGRSSAPQSPAHDVLSLADVFVPLDSIQPGNLSPVTLVEKNGLTVVIHLGQNIPRPDVSVMVVSMMSKNSSPLKNVIFQAAVPRAMKIKLQPPSATDLPPHNPILPPAAITQVLLLANPQKEKVRFKYKINYSMENQDHVENGEVDNLFGTR